MNGIETHRWDGDEDELRSIAALTCDPRAAATVEPYRSRGFRPVSERLDLGDGIGRLLLARELGGG